MATEVISNHHHRHQMELVVSSSPSDEDVSTSSTDVEMLIMPREKSSQDHSQDQVSTGVLVLTGPGSISTVGTVVDGEKNIEPGSQKPVQHQHYHYHYFYHVDPNNGGSGGPIPVTAISKSANPELMITAPSDHDQGDDSSSSSASSSVPSSPITPIPTSGDASPLLSSQNTSALVRTISNGSTFGPIIPNWPLFPPHHLTQSSSLSQVSQVHHDSKFESQVDHHHSRTTSEPLNLSNNKNITSECNNPSGAVILNTANSTSSTTTSPTSLHLNLSIPNNSTDSHQTNQQSPSLMINPVLPTINPTSNHDQSTVPVLSSSPTTSVAVVPVAVPRPVIRPTSTTTTILATAIPVEPALPDRLDLPLAFGDSFVLTSQIEASNLYRCVDTKTLEEYCVKVVLSRDYTDFCAGHHRMDGHEGINQIQKIIVGRKHCFMLFGQSYGDLHTYVRMKRRLREPEVMPLFQQIVQIVADCHKNGIILRDLKLRKFIFSNKERTQLKLETLEGASLFEDDDDTLADKHGCPAYVSPEILYSNSYSGMLADCWSLGVILYTMLVGRYPFHDTNPSVVFYKIRRGTYHIPENLTRHAKCLIRNLVRIDPNERLTAEDALAHRWFRSGRSQHVGGVWLKPHRTGGGHHHTLSAAAAAAAINHHHHHHHHHHTSSGSNPSTPSLVPSTNTSNSSNSRHPMSSSPYNESFNDQSMDAMQSSSGVVPSSPTSPMIGRTRSSVSTSSLSSNNPLINNQTNPNNSGPVRYTALLSTAASQFLNSNPETRNNIRNNNSTRTSSPSSSSPSSPGITNLGLANPFAYTSHSINNSTSVSSSPSSTPSTSSSSICCHYLASMGDQLVPDLSPNDSNEEEEVVVEPMMSD